MIVFMLVPCYVTNNKGSITRTLTMDMREFLKKVRHSVINQQRTKNN